ncbi:MAG: HD domain-containing protein [Planctomycetes bacterium]|nr:HD domain-containing protein [Planctomycetota bacterium]
MALSVGAFLVAVLLGFLGADRDHARANVLRAGEELALATSLAERGAPLLDKGDVLRLSVLATVVRDQAAGRALLLDRTGRVVIDTALVLGDKQLGLLSASGPFQRSAQKSDVGDVRETLVPIRFGGEVTGEVRLQVPVVPLLAAFDVTWFGLSWLACQTLVACAALLGHHWSSRVRKATDALMRLAAGEVAGAGAAGDEQELHDLDKVMRELERGMQDGLQRVGEGYAAMALALVDGLERRRLVQPGHGERTARLAGLMADRLQLLPADRADLLLACRLVDLGKAFVRPSILQKQGQLTEVEAGSLRHHPVRAAEQLDCVPGLRRVGKILRHQLERHDGKGSPDGLRGDRIPLGARVLAVAGAFDLLTTCASEPLDWQAALQQLQRARGEAFDPWLVDLLAEEVAKSPPPPPDREVMIVPAGGMPWRAPVVADAAEDDETDGDGELEVMFDDPAAEDHA